MVIMKKRDWSKNITRNVKINFMHIIKVFLDEVEISMSQARDLLNKHVRTYIVMESFMGGIPVETPEGMLRADVELD